MGTGIARGFLAAMDSGWMVKSWAQGNTPLDVLAERWGSRHVITHTLYSHVRLSRSHTPHSHTHTHYPSLSHTLTHPRHTVISECFISECSTVCPSCSCNGRRASGALNGIFWILCSVAFYNSVTMVSSFSGRAYIACCLRQRQRTSVKISATTVWIPPRATLTSASTSSGPTR